MIAKSDLVILGLATTLLVFGLSQLDANNPSKARRVSTTSVPLNTSIQTPPAQTTASSISNGATSVQTASYRQPGDTSSVSGSNVTPGGSNLTTSVSVSSTPSSTTTIQQDDNQTRTVIMQASGQSADVIVPLANVPLADTTATTALASDNQPESSNRYVMLTHTVRSGEYLNLLAKRYNTSVQELQQINGLNGTVIQVGQELLYPAAQ